jgi:hypothetical protein
MAVFLQQDYAIIIAASILMRKLEVTMMESYFTGLTQLTDTVSHR